MAFYQFGSPNFTILQSYPLKFKSPLTDSKHLLKFNFIFDFWKTPILIVINYCYYYALFGTLN